MQDLQENQGFSEAPVGETPSSLQDPGGISSAAEEIEGMMQDAGSEPSLPEQQAAAEANAAPEDISGQNDLDPLPGEPDTSDTEIEAQSAGEQTQPDHTEQNHGQDPADPDLYTVKVQGEERQVPLQELQQGFMLQSDYTQKTQALANERQEFHGEIEAVRQERQQYQHLLGMLDQQLREGMGEEPNWADLAQKDPVSYTRQKAAWDQKQKVLDAANQERQRVEQAQMQDHQRQVAAYNQQHREALLAAKPELQDPAEAQKLQQNLLGYAQQTYGLSPQELATLGDHRAVLILEKAMLFDQLQANGQQVQQKVRQAPNRVVRPGSAKGNDVVRSRSLRQANDRLATTGDTRDAAKVFESIL